MAQKPMEKVREFLGFEIEETESDVLETEQKTVAYNSELDNKVYNGKNNTVLNIYNSEKINIEVCKPNNFDEATEVVKSLLSGKSVVLNLEENSPEQSRRIFDFLTGALCALDGKAEKITRNIFLLAPKNVRIKSQETVEAKADDDVELMEFQE